MEYQNNEVIDNTSNTGNQSNMQQSLPNSVAVLVLGIVSIVMCFCYGFIGLVCGIIALILASKAKQIYNANPERYTLGSFKNMNAGRVCALIGTILSAILVIFMLMALAKAGFDLSEMEDIREQWGQ
jgi:hypothetical protein